MLVSREQPDNVLAAPNNMVPKTLSYLFLITLLDRGEDLAMLAMRFPASVGRCPVNTQELDVRVDRFIEAADALVSRSFDNQLVKIPVAIDKSGKIEFVIVLKKAATAVQQIGGGGGV